MRKLSLFLLLAVPLQAAELTREQKKAMVTEHYQRAFDLFKAEDYGRAIRHWESILELDPAQKSARSMIDQARRKIEEGGRDKERKVYDLVDKGKYADAQVAAIKLLEADQGNPDYIKLSDRLERVAKLVPSSTADDRAAKIFRQAMTSYLGRPENLKLAYDALRHARDLDPKNEPVTKVIKDFESYHSDVAVAGRITPGMELLEYKRFTALSHIYDGKYPAAIDVCHEVLALEPEDVLTLKRMGSAYFAMGQKDRAREIWTRALKLSPKDQDLRVFLSKVGGETKSQTP